MVIRNQFGLGNVKQMKGIVYAEKQAYEIEAYSQNVDGFFLFFLNCI